MRSRSPGAQRPEREADGRLCPRGGGQRQAQGGVQVQRKVPDPTGSVINWPPGSGY